MLSTNTIYPAQRSNVEDFKWRTIPFPYTPQNTHFLMFDSLNGWALSEYLQQLYQYENGDWNLIIEPDDIEYSEIFGFSKNNVWLGCFDKKKFRYLLRHFNGTKWSNIYPPNSDKIRDLAFIAADNIWGACEWGEIIHYNGKEWHLISSPTFGHLTSIAILNDSLGWATGEYRSNGTLMLWNGSKWKKIYELKKFQLERVLMVNSDIGWVLTMDKKPTGLRIERDQLFHTNFSSFLQDTILTSIEFFKKPTVFYYDKTVIQRGDIAYTDFNDNKREILISPWDGKDYDSFLFSSDGSVRYLQRKPDSTYSESKLLYAPEPLGNRAEYGVAFGDFDTDGDEDFYVINTERENRLNLYGGNQDIKSANPIHFVNAADELNILGVNNTESGDQIYDMGVSAADVDNDGDRELYIACLYGKNQLHENINGKRFREITVSAGLTCGTTRSNVGIWGDIDNDGDVDLFVTNEDTTNMLFLNDGAGHFREITCQSGLTSRRGGKGATFGDIDLDGDLDLVVPYFCLQNRIYRNEGMNVKTGLPIFTDDTKWWLPPGPDSLAKSASATFADVDNDGDLDLFIANLVFSNRLYENDGSGRFKDITNEVDLLDTSLSHNGCFFDADNDGDLDLYVTNRGKNLFFENQNGKKFVRGTKIFHAEQVAYSTGFACGDPDNDGDIDCYLCNNDQWSEYLRNSLNNRNFLKIKLIGTKSNHDALGAKTFLFESGHLNEKNFCLGLREINGGYGYGCQNSLVVHYGVNTGKMYDLKVQFPSGMEIIRRNIGSSQTLIIEEQVGWEKIVSISHRTFKRVIKTKSYQTEMIKFAFLLIIILTTKFIMRIKRWKKVEYQNLILCTPLILYLVIIFFVFEQGFISNHFLPMSIFVFSFGLVVVLLRRYATQLTKERLAEELLLNCRAFDHGGWATRPLNRLQLFSSNLLTGSSISESSKTIILDTISVFYAQVYKHINNIADLAGEAKIQIGSANELGKNLQQLTKCNLNNYFS